MNLRMEREKALELIEKYISNKNLIKHSLACEAIMRKLAKHFGEDEEIWGLAGLLHDIDYEITKEKPEQHGLKTIEILGDSINKEIKNAILSHSEKKTPETKIEIALYCVDPVSGFIVAAALVSPDRKLKSVNLEFLKNRFKEKWFAKGAKREQIKFCEKINLTLEEFLSISLEAMKEISVELEL